VATPLLEVGAPKSLNGRYQAADSLTLLDAPPFGQFVRFAKDSISNSMCLDPRTEQVVVIIDKLLGADPWLVNSSLGQFIESMRFVIGRLPFYGGLSPEEYDVDTDALDSMVDSVARELAESLRWIDPVAFSGQDSYWREFIDSVQMGDWATELIVGADAG
jgi:hypothetical protein